MGAFKSLLQSCKRKQQTSTKNTIIQNPPIEFISISQTNPQKESFSILTWNILADCYSQKPEEEVPINSQPYFKFDHRAPLIIKKLKQLNPDILCLQEVDQFEEFYQQTLLNLGYECFYEKKYQRKEGTLLAFKTSKFTLKSQKTLQFALAPLPPQFPPKIAKKIQKPNNLILLELLSKSSQKPLIVSTSHLFGDPKQSYIRYLQTVQWLYHLNTTYKDHENIIFCGDFNAGPTSNSIKLIEENLPPCKETIEIIEEIQNIKPEHIKHMTTMYEYLKPELRLNFQNLLKMLPQEYQDNKDLISYHHIDTDWSSMVDFLFYNKNSQDLTLEKILKPEDKTSIKTLLSNGTIPSQHFGSDHLPIMAFFQI